MKNKYSTLAQKIPILIWSIFLTLTLGASNFANAIPSSELDLNCNLNISTGNGSITIDGLNAGHVIVKLFNPNWSTNFECLDNCGNPKTISGLASGTYYLSVKLYNSNWSPICSQTEYITVTGGGNGGDKPDLRLADMKSPSSATAGDVVNYTIDVINSGNATANGSYTIAFYLSSNNTYSSNDSWVGQIQTGNTPVGTINNVPAAITLPANWSPGNYYLIGRTDIDNTIAESNENNNTTSKAITINADGGNDDDCGFLKTYNSGDIVNNFSASGSEVTETSTRYVFKSTTETNTNIQNSFFRIDKEGNRISSNNTNTNQSINSINVTRDGNNLDYTLTTPGGSLVWQRSTEIDPPGNQQPGSNTVIVYSEISRFNNGFLLSGTTFSILNGNQAFHRFQIVTNANGIVQNTNYYLASDTWSSRGTYKIPGSSAYLQRINTSGGSERLLRLSSTGAVVWDEPLIGDLPSTDIMKVRFSPDNQFVFFAVLDNFFARVRKVRLSNGQTAFDERVANLFSPGNSTFKELINDVLPTSDGGFIVSYTYEKPGQNLYGLEYGKINANGNVVWEGTLSESSNPDDYELTPVYETNNGGTLFIGQNETGKPVVMKLSSNAQLTPTCGGNTGEGNPLACDIDYSFSGGTLTLEGSGLNSGHVIIKVFGPSWQTEFKCVDNCGNPITVNGLSNGTYHISIATYTSSWSPICNELVDVNLGTGSALQNRENNGLFLFNATKDGRNADINWVVDNSDLTDYFLIERSGADVNFETLSEINSLSNSDQDLSYQISDKDPGNGFNYYRVKQVFTDGNFRYSQMRQIIFEEDLSAVSIFPNPAMDELYIQLKEYRGESANIIIYDQLGQVVLSQQVKEITGQALYFSTQDLANGFYQVAIKVGHRKMIGKKLVISKY